MAYRDGDHESGFLGPCLDWKNHKGFSKDCIQRIFKGLHSYGKFLKIAVWNGGKMHLIPNERIPMLKNHPLKLNGNLMACLVARSVAQHGHSRLRSQCHTARVRDDKKVETYRRENGQVKRLLCL